MKVKKKYNIGDTAAISVIYLFYIMILGNVSFIISKIRVILSKIDIYNISIINIVSTTFINNKQLLSKKRALHLNFHLNKEKCQNLIIQEKILFFLNRQNKFYRFLLA